ncbi:MAG TPA: hypothetical protein DGH68_09615 [Bacteroidetes bacterium]|nr:hypothetical protein [Bacteroidota bacterium]
MVMRFRSLLKKNKVTPAWVYQTAGVVWRLVPTDTGVFVGEDRMLDAKNVRFFCVDRKTGAVRWEGVSVAERWWTGIEAVHRDRVFLHGFTQPDMPDHKGIIALDLFTGRVSWSSDDLRFIFASEDSVFASKDTLGGRMICKLDLRTGSMVRSWEHEPEELSLDRSRMQCVMGNGAVFPTLCDEVRMIEEPALALAYEHCKKEAIVGPIDVLDRNELLFFSYHEKGNMDGQLQHLLKVADKKRATLVFTEMLEQNLRTVVPDSFFVQDDMLCFVKNRSLLTAVNIQQLRS